MSGPVPDFGTGHERIILIGEAPGRWEVADGQPFVGPSGRVLREWWRQVGLQRSDFYITNVYPYQPPGNKIEAIDTNTLAAYGHQLHARIASLKDPWLLVPTGNTALFALTGKKGILKHRGSIYEYVDRKGRRLKVIPTIHPAATFREPGLARRCRADWRRIASDAAFRELRGPQRRLEIEPTLADVEELAHHAAEPDALCAIDIETPRELTLVPTGKVVKKTGMPQLKKVWGRPWIKCLAVAFGPDEAISIPLTDAYWGPELGNVWAYLRELCAGACHKALQNGLFDAYYLAEKGIDLANWQWDTRWMHATLDPLDDHDLAYMASVDTRQPYWKDEAKDPDEIAKYASNFDALRSYNAIDAAVTWELAYGYWGKLADRQRMDFYQAHYVALYGPLLRMMRGGVRVDSVARAIERSRLAAALSDHNLSLAEIAGTPLFGPKGTLSPKKLAAYLYDTLRLPRQVSRQTGNVTTAEVTVRRLMLKYPDRLGAAGQHILDQRRTAKLMSFVKESVSDADGYVRCQYGFTVTGRLTSSKNPARTGQNLQNVDHELRRLYVPDPGHWFLEADLSQAESRVVYALTGDPALIELARLHPEDFDDHNRTAGLIFGCSTDGRWPGGQTKYKVTYEERQFGKRTRHASNYGMRGQKMSDELLKDGVVRSPEECDRWISTLLARDFAIVQWQQAVRIKVLSERRLVNSWGRMIDFTWERLHDETYRVAYAWQPQSEIGDLMNQWGVVPVDRWLAGRRSRLALQTHDSVTVSGPPDELYDVAQFLRESLERPRTYGRADLTIPVTFKVGRTWAMDQEFKRLPDRATFMEACR